MPFRFNPFTGNFDETGSGGGSTSPGGSNTQLQYNNNGVFAGISTMTFDGTSVTLAGRLINSYNSASLAPAKVFTGTWATGFGATNTKPHFLIEPTGTSSGAWSPNGTGLGVNAASGFAGNLLDLQVNGSRKLSVSEAGTITNATGGTLRAVGGSTWFFDNTVYLGSLAIFANSAGTELVSLARDAANTLAQRNGTNAQTYRLYKTYTDASNYERAKLAWNSNVFEIGTEGAGTGSEKPVRITAATLKLPNLPTYADNAAAATGGLVAGDVYKTATGELRITV